MIFSIAKRQKNTLWFFTSDYVKFCQNIYCHFDLSYLITFLLPMKEIYHIQMLTLKNFLFVIILGEQFVLPAGQTTDYTSKLKLSIKSFINKTQRLNFIFIKAKFYFYFNLTKEFQSHMVITYWDLLS